MNVELEQRKEIVGGGMIFAYTHTPGERLENCCIDQWIFSEFALSFRIKWSDKMDDDLA